MESAYSLQQISARALIAAEKELKIQLADLPILGVLKKYWDEERIAAYIADAVYYPQRYRLLYNNGLLCNN